MCLLPGAVLACGGVVAAERMPSGDAVRHVMRKVNDHWMRRHPVPGNSEWARAVYFAGCQRAHESMGWGGYLGYGLRWAEENDWEVGGYLNDPTFADNQACGQVYHALHGVAPDEEKLASVRASLQMMLDRPEVDDWWWIDAFFMAGPVFARFDAMAVDEEGAAYDMRYRDKLWALYHDMGWVRDGGGLFDAEAGLWFRDKGYFYPGASTANGGKVFWGRGNGWVMAGLARTLEWVAEDDPHRADFEWMLETMAAALVPLQGADGMWRSSLADPAEYPAPETSATAFFTFAVMWGINHGLLDEEPYLPVVARAWNGMVALAVHADGKLGYVQRVGKEPALTGFDETQDFGVGAFLMAGAEILRYHGQWPVFAEGLAGEDQVSADPDGDGLHRFQLSRGLVPAGAGDDVSTEWKQDGTVLAVGDEVEIEVSVGENQLVVEVTGEDGTVYVDQVVLSVDEAGYVPEVLVTASGDDGNVAENAVDGVLGTRWSSAVDGAWLELDFGVVREVAGVTLAWFQGNLRTAYFDIQVPDGSGAWRDVITGAAGSGTTLEEELFVFEGGAELTGKVRYVGHGNNWNAWNSVTEFGVSPEAEPGGEVDADADGLPDSWEMHHAGSLALDPDADDDGDGLPARWEYVRGTDPGARNGSQAGIVVGAGDGGGVDLQVLEMHHAFGPGYSGQRRIFAIERTDFTAGSGWLAVPGHERIPGHGQGIRYAPDAGDGRGFFRLKCWLEARER